MRTFEQNAAYHKALVAKGAKADDAKKFFNCRHLPILSSIGLVLGKVSVAPLHLLLGLTDKVVGAAAKEVPSVEAWLTSINVKRAPQHGQRPRDLQRVKLGMFFVCTIASARPTHSVAACDG